MTRWTRGLPVSTRSSRSAGVAALVDGAQVALFRSYDGEVYAIGNLDPFSGAAVLSRGIVGTRGDGAAVASPMHKQVFDLRTGAVPGRARGAVPVYPVRIREGLVEVAAPWPTRP